MNSRGSFLQAVWQVLSAGSDIAEDQVEQAEPPIQIHSNQLVQPPITLYKNRYLALHREQVVIQGTVLESFDKIPSLLIDSISEEPLEDFVVPSIFMSHAINKNSCLGNKNPFTQEVIMPLPDVLSKYFTDQERTLLIETVHAANIKAERKLDYSSILNRLIDSKAPIEVEFTISELQLFKVLLENDKLTSVNLSLQKNLEFHIRYKLTTELLIQRELFYSKLEAIKNLKELLLQKQFHFDCSDLSLTDDEKSRLVEQHKRDVLEIRYNLIATLSKFISNTKEFITSVHESKDIHQEEINRVLRDEFKLLQEQIVEFKKLRTELNETLSIADHEGISLDVLKAMIVHPSVMFFQQQFKNTIYTPMVEQLSRRHSY